MSERLYGNDGALHPKILPAEWCELEHAYRSKSFHRPSHGVHAPSLNIVVVRLYPWCRLQAGDTLYFQAPKAASEPHLSLERGCRGMSSSNARAECRRGMPPRTRPSSLAPPRWHLSHSESLLWERMLPGDSMPDSKFGLLVTGLMFRESLLGYACTGCHTLLRPRTAHSVKNRQRSI